MPLNCAYRRGKISCRRSRSGSKRRCSKKYGCSKSKVRIIVNKGLLTKYGYSMSKTAAQRHYALSRAVSAYGYLPVMRKVNVLFVFNKNRHSNLAKVATSDKKWLMKTYKNKASARKSYRRKSKRRSGRKSRRRSGSRKSRRRSGRKSRRRSGSRKSKRRSGRKSRRRSGSRRSKRRSGRKSRRRSGSRKSKRRRISRRST
jgi:hypothetical protein